MRVLFVSSGNSKHGIIPFIKSQGESLIKEGVELEYYTIKGKGLKGYLKNVFELKDFLKKRNFDIVHAHYGLSALVAFFSKKKEKIVVSFMGSDIFGGRDLTNSPSIMSKISLKVNKLFAKRFYNYNIVKSKEMFNVLNVKNCEVVPNGVDFEKFYEIDRTLAKQKIGKDISKKLILFCSNPERKEKNFKLAKDAFDKLAFNNKELICLHGIAPNELKYYFNMSDCLLLTSFYEGSPNVVKEAMACNVPIVATNVGDVKDVMGNTKGCYVSSFKLEDVVSSLEKALAYEGRTTGRNDIEYLEMSKVAKKIIELYKKTLKK